MRVGSPVRAEHAPNSEHGRWFGKAAVLAFAVGAIAPSLIGLELSQRPPSRTGDGLEAPAPLESESTAAPSQAPGLSATAVVVREVVVTDCFNAEDERAENCDTPTLAGHIEPALERLLECPEATPPPVGTLSLGVALDFGEGVLSEVRAGASTTLPSSIRDALVECAHAALVGAPLKQVAHRYARYWIYYVTDFTQATETGAGAGSSGNTPIVLSSGRAAIRTASATVRVSPSAKARAVRRLAKGTHVRISERSGSFYHISYANPSGQGWVEGSALGL